MRLNRAAWGLTVAASAGLLLAGCNEGGGTTPSPDASGTSSSTASRSPALKDRSAEVMAGMTAPTEVARTKGKAASELDGATLVIYSLTRTDTSTVLTFALTGPGSGPRLAPGHWPRFPVLKTDKDTYPPVTWLKEPTAEDPWYVVHNPMMWPKADVLTPPQTVLYPSLPAGTTSITLTGTWFEDVTVAVS